MIECDSLEDREDSPCVRLVDDDATFRRALHRVLCAAGYRVAEYGSVGEMLLDGFGSAPGCLVMDIHMPGPSGLDLQEMIATQPEPLPVIFVTAQATVHETLRAMKAGAADFFFKPVDSAALLRVVAKAIEDDALRRRARLRQNALQARYSRLSPRERQVLDMVVNGALNKQIGWELGAAERTVKAHRAHVMEKMEVRSLAELVKAVGQLESTLK
ncbi:response regulator [Variovorax humicola]|uniref:Response regulator n=1 Tax=Variovorax humicola TaxID=1769758 RepID=A0ABU8W665_9BURK